MRAAGIRRKGISRRSEFSVAECDRVPVVSPVASPELEHLQYTAYRVLTIKIFHTPVFCYIKC